MLNRKETFEKVLAALRVQGVPSKSEYNCLYHGPNGTKCAVGHLIPDEVYTPDMEYSRIEDNRLVIKALDLEKGDIPFLQALQDLHDMSNNFYGEPFEMDLAEFKEDWNV